MKAYRFRLQRVLDLRKSELTLEEHVLEQLWFHRATMQSERDALAASLERMRTTLQKQQFLHPSDLVVLDRYKNFVERELQKWAQKLAAHDAEIEKQKACVVAARGRVKLLEKLRERSHGTWQHEANRELEELASDFAATQWLRERNA